MNGVSFLKKDMNGVSFSLKKYMNGSCFSLSLVYEWGGVRGLQPHIRTQNHGKLTPPPCVRHDKNRPLWHFFYTWDTFFYGQGSFLYDEKWPLGRFSTGVVIRRYTGLNIPWYFSFALVHMFIDLHAIWNYCNWQVWWRPAWRKWFKQLGQKVEYYLIAFVFSYSTLSCFGYESHSKVQCYANMNVTLFRVLVSANQISVFSIKQQSR